MTTYHSKPKPKTAEDFPSLQDLWERLSQDLRLNSRGADHIVTILENMFFAGFAACHEIHLDIASLPSEEEAAKVILMYAEALSERAEKARAQADSLLIASNNATH